MRPPLALIALLLLAPPIGWSAPSGGDTATPRAGDIHSGRAKIERIELVTDYGTLSLPLARLARIELDDDGARILTHFGERLHGRIEPIDIPFERVDGPLITLHLHDLTRLEPAASPPPPTAPTRWLELVGGDRLLATAEPLELRLDGAPITLTERGRLQLHTGDEGTRGRLEQGGVTHQGPIEERSVRLRTTWGAPLTLPLERIETLAPTDTPLVIPSAAGERLRDPLIGGGQGPEMVILPAARYRRGDLSGGGDGDERPVQWIELPRPFAIGRFEVSFDDYDRYARDEGVELADDSEWGRGRRPAVNVAWREAVAYADWLSRKSGRRYRLPSEAEWEYAARGSSEGRYWWGDEAGRARADCAGCGSLWDGERSAPGGSFPANPFGLYDTAGNVWEWTADCYQPDYARAPTDGRPLSGTNCGKRVIRGGGWSFPPEESRPASRWRDFASRRSDDTGFRLVRELDEEEIRAFEARR